MRHTPHFEHSPEKAKRVSSIEITNRMQRELMHQYDDSNKWVIVYAQKFREIIEEEPNLIAEFEDDSKKCVSKLMEKLQKRIQH